MTRIDFAFGAADRLRVACQIVRKRYRARQTVVVYSSDATRLKAFDTLLWAFDDVSFVPHVQASDPLASVTAVVLTASAPVPPEGQASPWLLNLDDACPPDYSRFERVMEVVSAQPEDRQAARQRWRTYQSEGHEVVAHELAQGGGA